MYLNDPTLYGATLPQREIPFVPPFMANYAAPWQWQQNPLPFQHTQRFIPPTYQHGMQPPFFPQVHGQVPQDPAMFGTNIPQREIPFVPPFMPNYFTPWNWQQNLLPFQQNMLPFQQTQRFIPPTFQHGIPPFFPQAFGTPTQPFAQLPFVPPAFNPFVPTGVQNFPFYGWQKPLTY